MNDEALRHSPSQQLPFAQIESARDRGGAAQIAAGSLGIELDTTSEASVEMNDAPTSPPTAATVLRQLWAQNELGLKASRYFTVERLHSSAVAVISGASYSPP